MERERVRREFLAAALCHELKQPLHSMNINAELLGRRLEKAAADVGVAAPLNALARAVDRVSACIDAYAARALPEPAPSDAVDVPSLLEGALDRAREAAERAGVLIVLDPKPALPAIPGSALQLGVAIDCLLDNAIHASSPGSSVSVHALLHDDALQIEIADRGHGMVAEITRRAFEIGFSTWDGDGIGLTIAKFIVYHHSGGLSLRSSPGEGTTVTLALPLVSENDDD